MDISVCLEYNNRKVVWGRGCAMNEIITKLNEIEEKADALLADARSRREQLASQVERDKQEIDAKYDRLEAEAVKRFEQKYRSEADAQVEAFRRKMAEKTAALADTASGRKEQLAEEIVKRVLE